MTGGFWSGAVPPWAYVIGVCLCLLFLLTGMWVGYGRGWDECERDRDGEEGQGFGIERPPELDPRVRAARAALDAATRVPSELAAARFVPPEVAHAAWEAHAEQAMHLANPVYPRDDDVCPHCGGPGCLACDARQLPDPRTDSEWTADMAASMDAFIGSLLNDHPATEDL